uniref:Protein phosphatase n=1 Tax=Schistosoma japonicum TaxID=6182 RepID=C7TYW3_SCHJA|nr:protein phosphatase [Schistosoma japonicum]
MGGSMTKILPGLFVGGLDNAKNEEELMANCISHILIVQDSKNDIEKSISRQYLHLIVSEKLENSLLRQIQLSNDFIHRSRLDSGNVLVCSDSGLSANVAVVAAYLMTVYTLDYYSAISALRGLRYGAHPVEPLQKQLIEFDNEYINPLYEQNKEANQKESSELKIAYNATLYLKITSASERERLKSIYGEWPYLEEDLQILHSALNSHLNSTEDPDFLFNNNIDNSEYDKTMHKDEDVNTIGDNDRIMTPTIIPSRVVAVEHNLVNDSIQTMVDTSSVQSVIQHNIRHSLSDSDLQQLDSTLLDKEKDITLLNSSNGNNNHTDNVNDERGGNDLDNIPLVSVPVNDAIFPDNIIEVNSLKPSPDESDVFVVDPTQLPKNWDHISHTSSSIKSDNSLEIGFELKDDDIDDNVPGAIEIPTIDSIQIRNRGESHTYNNHHPYSHSNLSRSMHHNTIAHSLYPPPTTTTTNMNDNLFTCQSMFPTTNVYNFNHRINSTDINDLQSFNLSSTALNYDIFSRLDVS